MSRLAYRSAIAAVALSGLALGQMNHHSLSGSMIAGALSRLGKIKAHTANTVASKGVEPTKTVISTPPVAPVTVATAVTGKADNGTFVMEPPHPKFSGSEPVKTDIPVAKIDGDANQAKATDTKTAKPAVKVGGSSGLVTNLYDSQDIRSVISDVASQTGVTIVADDTVKEQNITLEFKDATLDSALNTLALMAGAYWKKKDTNLYLISKALPDSNLFREFAETKIYTVHNQKAASIQSLLSASYKPYISVDASTNSIGVSAPKQLLEKILADIEQADRPGKQIIVEALITEVSAEDGLNTGFSWATKKVSFGTDMSLNYQKAGFADIAKIQALISDHKATLRANPRLMTIEGRESNVNVGTDSYFSLLSGSTTFPTSQIQLIHTGIILKFTGFIGTDGTITMHLEPEVSDAVVLQNGNPSSQVRRSSQDVRVKSGETIVIAGLMQQTMDNQIVRVPLLGYIPLVGEIFTQRNKTRKKVETIIMVTPKIVDDAPQ